MTRLALAVLVLSAVAFAGCSSGNAAASYRPVAYSAAPAYGSSSTVIAEDKGEIIWESEPYYATSEAPAATVVRQAARPAYTPPAAPSIPHATTVAAPCKPIYKPACKPACKPVCNPCCPGGNCGIPGLNECCPGGNCGIPGVNDCCPGGNCGIPALNCK